MIKTQNMRIIPILFLLLFLTACTTSTSPQQEAKPQESLNLRIGALTGPTAMGMVKLMDDSEHDKSGQSYTFTLAGSADELIPALIRGDLDMAAIPANLASILYHETEGAFQVLAVNTLGVLSIVEAGADTIQTIQDLAGQTIYATGKGSTPEYTLRFLLTSYGMDPDRDVTIEWKSEPAETVALLAEEGGVAMLPQPYATAAQGQVSGLRFALDLSQEWKNLSDDSFLITGVMVVNTAFAKAQPKSVEAFLSAYAESIRFSNQNTVEAAQLIESYHIIKASVAEKALPHCNLVFLSGSELKTALGGYLEVLYEQNPKAVGGSLPKDDFFYPS